MFRKTICACGLLVLLVSISTSAHNRAAAQEKAAIQKSAEAQDTPKPLDPDDPRLTFSFPVHEDWKPFRFKVELNRTGMVTGVQVFREGESKPFQTLSADGGDLSEPVTEGWDRYEISMLIDHADLNFDGFEDLEWLQYYIPHLGKKLYWIYLWDNKAGIFRYSNELAELSVNPVPHPENKTLTTHEDWQGGAWQESTYRWNDGKLELIEQNSLLGDWGDQSNGKCGFHFSCSRLIKGKMVTTLEKPICDVDEMQNLPDCSAATPPASKAPAKKPSTEKKN